MPIKSILSYVGDTGREAQLSLAIASAKRFDAHLSVAAIAIDPEMTFDGQASIGVYQQFAEFHAEAQHEAGTRAQEATDRLAAEGVRGDVFPMVTTHADLAWRFGGHARYVDLVTLALAGAEDHMAAGVFEGAVFDGDAAVLLCPDSPDFRPRRVMIAWDASPAALRAVRRANPFLADAEEVEIALVDGSAAQARAAEDLALMLSRYGLAASIVRLASDGRSDAETLKRHQVEAGIDLTVMGAFGHSRFREFLLGGVTRELPQISASPLLLAR